MKILIELPTWLGDSVMVTPAIENLVRNFDNVEITLIGSLVSTEVLKNHPKVVKIHILDKKFINLYKILNNLGEFDLFLSFKSSFRSRFIKFCITSKKKYQFNKKKYKSGHLVEQYNNFVNDKLQINTIAGKLILHTKRQTKNTTIKSLGINPGASYGSAKRWYPKEFAKVAR